jgi:hypothetical protein
MSFNPLTRVLFMRKSASAREVIRENAKLIHSVRSHPPGALCRRTHDEYIEFENIY